MSTPLQDEIDAVRETLAKLERRGRSQPRGPFSRTQPQRKAARKRAKASRKRNR